jgi:hypothetical protein
MRQRLLAIACATVLLLGISGTAFASSVHFKPGGSPVCTVTLSGSSSSTVCSATLAGLGNGDLAINVTVAGFAVYQCQNGGGNIAPGQNKVLVGPSTTPTIIPGSQIKNGNVSFTTNPAVLSAPSTVTAAQAGCPNQNWTGVNPTLTLTSIEMTITQFGVQLFDCKANNSSGLSGSVALTC